MEFIIIRGKRFFIDNAKKISKKRFCELFADKKARVIEEAWTELLELTGRLEQENSQPKKKTKKKKA